MYAPVVVGIDGSPASLAAASWAAEEAIARRLPLRVLHAVALMPHLLPAGQHSGPDPLHEALHLLAVRHPEASVRGEEVRDTGTAALLAAAEEAELLVLGARGSGGFGGLRMGSVALHVASRAACPTVVLPPDPSEGGPQEQVVVGVNGRVPPEAALDFAFAAALRYGLPLRVVHAWPPPRGVVGLAEARTADRDCWRAREAGLLAEALAGWKTVYPAVSVTEDAEAGGAAEILVEASAKARLLVLGRRPGFSGGRLGPVAHAVLHHASCPVAVIPEPIS